MAIFGLWVCATLVAWTFFKGACTKVINKAGGLVYQRNFAGCYLQEIHHGF